MRTLTLTVAVFLCLLTASGAARAAGHKGDEMAQHAARLYVVGRYADALKEYQDAFVAGADAKLLVPIGRCHRALGQPAQAVEVWRNYLEQAPRAPDRAEVERLIAEAQAAAPAAASPAPAPAPAPATPPAAAPPAPIVPLAAAPPPAAPYPRIDLRPNDALKRAHKERNRGLAKTIVGGFFAFAAVVLIPIATWQYFERGSKSIGGHVLGPGIPGVISAGIAIPLLMSGLPQYASGKRHIVEAEAAAGAAP